MKKLGLLLIAFVFATSCADLGLDLGDLPYNVSEWEAIAFIKSDKFVAKLDEMDSCYESGRAQCRAILREWSDLCERGNDKYCVGIFEIHKALRKDSRALDESLAVLNQKCENGEAITCLAVGSFYSNESSALNDAKKGLTYLQKSCHLGIASGCATMAYFDMKNTKNAKAYLDKSIRIADRDCKTGQKLACEAIKEWQNMIELQMQKQSK